MHTYRWAGENAVRNQRRLALMSAAGAVGGVVGFLLDGSQRMRGLLVGAVTGASFAGMVSAKIEKQEQAFDYYSEGKRLYEEYETEAGI
jgi:uncharacterized protein YcfJ